MLTRVIDGEACSARSHSVKVAFDAHMIGRRETGNESYAVNLLRALTTGWPDDVYEVLTTNPSLLASVLQLPLNAHAVRVWPGWSPLRITLAIPSMARLKRADVLHMTTYVTPPWPTTPTVVTVHDLSYLKYPNAFSPRVRTMLKTLVPASVRVAARVIAVSEQTKRDLVSAYGLPAEKVVVTPLAPGPAFIKLEDPGELQLPRGITEPYVLAVGNLEPRKNLDRLLDAFFVTARDRGFDGKLVLVGKGSGAQRILAKVRQAGFESRVVLTGFVTEAELVVLYNRAKLFVYPSLYEGFGLPPVEAMACGCPVVASNTSVLPETLGDAAILVNPESVRDLAQAMSDVLERDDLAESLRGKGMKRALAFTWAKTASITRIAYQDAIASSRAHNFA
jgi:glycosyltransferase involved in cell wall biosynthesis